MLQFIGPRTPIIIQLQDFVAFCHLEYLFHCLSVIYVKKQAV
jgi:hypothetical protein